MTLKFESKNLNGPSGLADKLNLLIGATPVNQKGPSGPFLFVNLDFRCKIAVKGIEHEIR